MEIELSGITLEVTGCSEPDRTVTAECAWSEGAKLRKMFEIKLEVAELRYEHMLWRELSPARVQRDGDTAIVTLRAREVWGQMPLSVAEAAIRTGRSPSAVRQAITDGRLPGEKVGTAWKVYPDDLEAWLHRSDPRGRPPAPMLSVRCGNAEGFSFQAQVQGLELGRASGGVKEGSVRAFRSAAVRWTQETSDGKESVMATLTPREKRNELDIGPFGVVGRFRVVEEIRDPVVVKRRWKEFEAR